MIGNDVHQLSLKYEPNRLDGGAVIKAQTMRHTVTPTDLKFGTQVWLDVSYHGNQYHGYHSL